jgi:hypothetical protein
VGLEHVLRGLQAVGRREEALALGHDLDRAAGDGRVEGLLDRDVERRGLDVVEVADLARVEALLLAGLGDELAELGADLGRHEDDVAGETVDLRLVGRQVLAEDLVHVDDLLAGRDGVLHAGDEAGAEDRLDDDRVVVARARRGLELGELLLRVVVGVEDLDGGVVVLGHRLRRREHGGVVAVGHREGQVRDAHRLVRVGGGLAGRRGRR